MRLNRGTVLLLAVSLIVIVIVVLVNSQQATAPDVTPTAAASAAGAVFPSIASVDNQGDINRFEVVNNVDSTHFLMTKDDGGVWTVTKSSSPSELATDQTKAVGTMSILASLAATDSFTTDSLADFGLDAPKYVLTLTAKDGTTYVVNVGNQSPANPRYYGLINDDTTTVYLLPKDTIDNLVKQITQPPYVASPTPTPTFTPSPNPYSEVQQTATAGVQQTATAQATLEMTPEVTAEATEAATAEATPES